MGLSPAERPLSILNLLSAGLINVSYATENLTSGVQISPLCERNQSLRNPPQLFRLGLGRPNRSVQEQRSGQIVHRCASVTRCPAELTASLTVPHRAAYPLV